MSRLSFTRTLTSLKPSAGPLGFAISDGYILYGACLYLFIYIYIYRRIHIYTYIHIYIYIQIDICLIAQHHAIYHIVEF